MHDDIRKFSLEGTLGEPNIVQTKERLVNWIESQMRDYGYVPSLDNEPQFTLDYNIEAEGFDFSLSVYGVKVGKEKSWNVSGITTGKAIAKFIRKNKSNQLSNYAQ